MVANTAVRYAVVDTFTDRPFKGNSAAVCLLQGGDERDVGWMQSVAVEFNLSMTVFMLPDTTIAVEDNPRFHLWFFTPACERNLCGHGTLAAAHFLFTYGISKSEAIEFATKSGLLIAKKTSGLKNYDTSTFSQKTSERLFIELDFPAIQVTERPSEIPSIPKTLKGTYVVSVLSTTDGDFIVELASGQDVVNVQPDFDELRNSPARAIIITGAAPHVSGFDFYSRVFGPKIGVNEDQVTGSVHCALAPYWSKKLGKHDLVAYQASQRGGRLDLHWNEQTKRVQIIGEAITVMSGTISV